MRNVLGVSILLLLSAQAASAVGLEFWERLERLSPLASLRAYEYLECTQSAAKKAAERDKASPSRIMAEWAASEAARQCSTGGRLLAALAGHRQASAVRATVHRINVESALAVRRGDPIMVCAVAWRGCHMK
jgi:hypothetical protein